MKIEFLPRSAIDAGQWTALVDESPEGWLCHRPEYIALRENDCRSFGILQDGALGGVCVLYRQPRSGGAVLAGPGPALSARANRKHLLPALREELERLGRREGCQAVWVHLPVLASDCRPPAFSDSILGALGFACDLPWGQGIFRHPAVDTVVDLTQTAEDIMTGLSQNHRRAYAKANQSGMTIETHTGHVPDNIWNGFVEVHAKTYARSMGQKPSPRWYHYARALLRADLCRLTVLRSENVFGAAVLVETFNNKASYLAGGCHDTPQQQGGYVLLHVNTMLALAQEGFTHYETGFHFPTLTGTKLWGIGEFKRKFGGLKVPVIAGELILNEDDYMDRIVLPYAQKGYLRRRIPSLIRTALRKCRAISTTPANEAANEQ